MNSAKRPLDGTIHLHALGLNLKAETRCWHHVAVAKIAQNTSKATKDGRIATHFDLLPATFRVNPEAVFCSVSGWFCLQKAQL
jgi:hypothetical protein